MKTISNIAILTSRNTLGPSTLRGPAGLRRSLLWSSRPSGGRFRRGHRSEHRGDRRDEADPPLPLGGLGEFGLNALVLEWDGHLLLIDAGMLFPTSDMPGVDFVVPDFAYLAERRDSLCAVLLTHGHEDHIGALSYALAAAPAPVYGSALTLGFARQRLRERGVAADLRTLTPGQPVEIGPFRVHPIRVAHSVLDSLALAIETPAGVVLASGDFKIDAERSRSRAHGRRCALGVGSPGRARAALGQHQRRAEGRDRGRGHGRAGVRGDHGPHAGPRTRLLLRHLDPPHAARGRRGGAPRPARSPSSAGAWSTTRRLRWTSACCASPRTVAWRPGAVAADGADRKVVFVSGSQGEPLSALSLVSVGEHREMAAGPGDTAVLSSRADPRQRAGRLAADRQPVPPRLRGRARRHRPRARLRTRQPGRPGGAAAAGAPALPRADPRRVPDAGAAQAPRGHGRPARRQRAARRGRRRPAACRTAARARSRAWPPGAC